MQVFYQSRLEFADKYFHAFTLLQKPHKAAADPQLTQHLPDTSHLQITRAITATMQHARG